MQQKFDISVSYCKQINQIKSDSAGAELENVNPLVKGIQEFHEQKPERHF